MRTPEQIIPDLDALKVQRDAYRAEIDMIGGTQIPAARALAPGAVGYAEKEKTISALEARVFYLRTFMFDEAQRARDLAWELSLLIHEQPHAYLVTTRV